MEKPKLKGFGPESYDLLFEYANHLETKLLLEGDKLEGTELGILKAQVKFAWKEVHDMAIDVARIYAELSKSALNHMIQIV